jgi:uncharacterized protein (DUF488 family)
MRKSDEKFRIYTIGHSTRPITEFLEILDGLSLKLVVDVRTIPKSRHNPQYGGTRLKRTLAKNKIQYVHMEDLGGLRKRSKNSVNLAWRNKSFQGYADYMQTEEFQKALAKLISKAKRKRLVIMCAEAVPWRCHRSLIADALVAKKIKVGDIFSKTSVRPHKLTSFAKVTRGRVTYPP